MQIHDLQDIQQLLVVFNEESTMDSYKHSSAIEFNH